MFTSTASNTLVLLRDASTATMWLDRWSYSYPTVQTGSIVGGHSIGEWQRCVQHVIDQVPKQDHIMLVAHGAAANALAAWYYQSDTATQRRITGIILVSPICALCHDDAQHTFQRIRFNCRTALVVGQNDPLSPQDWAEQQAQLWQARCLISPHQGHLDAPLDGWQWGMKLMQEMLLD